MSYQGNTIAVQQPKTQTLLESQVGQIESRLKGLAEVQEQIGQSINRLINPRPTDAAAESVQPPSPATIEGRLQNIVRTLDCNLATLRDHAQILDSAI